MIITRRVISGRRCTKVCQLVFLTACLACNDPDVARIRLTPDMVINEVAKGDATMLIDEQGTSQGFPVHLPTTRWTINVAVGEPEWYLPANAVIDLGHDHVITSIFLFDGDGLAGNCHINYGIPFRWTPLLTDSLLARNEWRKHDVGRIRTRFIQISRTEDSDIREIVLHGYPAEELRLDGNDPPPADREPITLEKAIGVNTHHLDPFARVKVAGIVREYHNWILNEGGFTKDYPGYPGNAIQFNPGSPMQTENATVPLWDPATRGGFDFDTYYKELKDAGITVFPCIQGTVPWLSGEPNTKSRHKPVKAGTDPANPLSYTEHADFMFQYAARYGSAKVSEQLLKAAPGQTRESGLGYLEYYENWNEPDGWWGGRRDYFTPYEYAAMSSADYDGHESRMGKDKGIRNADPTARLVMSGIAIPNVDYLRAMKFWFDHNRTDKRFVFDVITVHHYCNAKGSQAEMTEGISPEEDGLKAIVKKIADFRDAYAPDREVWVTEFGWDTNPVTPQSAPSPDIQGQWLVRAYLECFAGGIDRVMMYMMRDVDPKSEIQFSSSGLIGPLGDFQPKPSWYYVYTMRNQLAGLLFHREHETSDERVRTYEFRHPEGEKSVFVLWSPQDGETISGYVIDAPHNSISATVVTLADKKINGESHQLEIHNGKATLNVTSSPVFVTFTEKK